MKNSNKIKTELERIIALGGFHAKVAITVLNSKKLSFKQMDILDQVSEFAIEIDEFEKEFNTPLDFGGVAFDGYNQASIKRQSVNL